MRKSFLPLIVAVKLLLVILFTSIVTVVTAQQKIIPLYNGVAPGSETWNWEEKTFFVKTPLNANVVYNVTRPTVTVFSPDSANGTAVILCPGGGLRVLNIETEGSFVAKELNKKGITVFLLKSRLIRSITDDPWAEMLKSLGDTAKFRADNGQLVRQMMKEDATTAIQYVRQHAAEYKIDEKKIGVMGFSGGGPLTLYLSLYEKKEIRPNFAVFIYSVYRPKTDLPIPANAPPAFIACATDDIYAASTNSIDLYSAWIASKNSAELHIYSKGGHGLRASSAAVNWINRFTEWLDTQGYLKPKQ